MPSYSHFTSDERNYLYVFLCEGFSIREIARRLGRAPSSVSREIKRNSSKKATPANSGNPYKYHPWRAEVCARLRKRKPRWRVLHEGTDVWDYIIEKLNLYWSPEEIAMRWNKDHPGEHLSFSTIYRYIKRHLFPGIRTTKHLRRRGKNRHLVHHNCSVILAERRIPDWPKEIAERLRVGDWEGDTVYGGIGKGLLVTLVDRKTRFLCAHRINSRDAVETRLAIQEMLKDLPIHSLSLDNGSEFAEFEKLEEELGAPIYFAEPHKPWQRGTNENMNGILRFFFRKGHDFHSTTDSEVQTVVDSINNRPRKCLGWLSPAEILSVALG